MSELGLRGTGAAEAALFSGGDFKLAVHTAPSTILFAARSSSSPPDVTAQAAPAVQLLHRSGRSGGALKFNAAYPVRSSAAVPQRWQEHPLDFPFFGSVAISTELSLPYAAHISCTSDSVVHCASKACQPQRRRGVSDTHPGQPGERELHWLRGFGR